jgi:DNA-binding FadR family transcriptional regulator
VICRPASGTCTTESIDCRRVISITPAIVPRKEFHTALLVASHNHVLMQLASVIRASMRALFELTTHLGSAHEQALHLHGAVVEAVRLRQPDMAKAAIVKILETAVSDLHSGDGSSLH